jgi:hypothetical protein
MAGKNKVDSKTKQERVYEISLLLRRKPINFIIEHIRTKWGLEKAQAYNYIKDARIEWKKYFTNLKHAGISYHITQVRDLKDEAYSQKVVIGKGEDKKIIEVPNLGLILEIIKEESKIMGIYPTQGIDVKHSGKIDNKVEHIMDMEEGELDKFIEILIERKKKINDGTDRKEEKRD